MRILICILSFIVTISCTNEINNSNVSPNITYNESMLEIDSKYSSQVKSEVENDFLPIHGNLNIKQIETYYPKILDTVKDLRIIGSEQLDLININNIYVSILQNTDTFNQMFLCTHDIKFHLLDTYYIGKSTMFDLSSHTIEYNILREDQLEFHHVDWGYLKGNDQTEIDTLDYRNYTLTVLKTGEIIKE